MNSNPKENRNNMNNKCDLNNNLNNYEEQKNNINYINTTYNNNISNYTILESNKLNISINNINKINKKYKTENNTPNFNTKIKNIIVNDSKEKNKIDQIKELKALLNSDISANNTTLNDSNNINHKRNNQYDKIDSTQNERLMKFYNYTFSQKSDNTNNNNFHGSYINLYLNHKSSNLRDLIEENHKKIYEKYNKGKLHSYSPKIKYNFPFHDNNKKNKSKINHIITNEKSTSIKNNRTITPTNNHLNYKYNSQSAKILENKKYKNKSNLIKDIKFNNNAKKKVYINSNININKVNSYKNSLKFNNRYEDKMRLNSLSESKNMKLSFNFEEQKNLLNNKSYECIMPPNDLSDIYKKNIIFSKIINN